MFIIQFEYKEYIGSEWMLKILKMLNKVRPCRILDRTMKSLCQGSNLSFQESW